MARVRTAAGCCSRGVGPSHGPQMDADAAAMLDFVTVVELGLKAQGRAWTLDEVSTGDFDAESY